MANTQIARVHHYLFCDETVDLAMDAAANPPIHHTFGQALKTYTATTSPAVTKTWSDTRVMAGAETLDLNALPMAAIGWAGGGGLTTDFVGLKLQLLYIEANSANNAAGILFAVGALNPYHFLGAAADRVTLLPGCKYGPFFFNGKLATIVLNTNDEIDVTGAVGDIYSIMMIAG